MDTNQQYHPFQTNMLKPYNITKNARRVYWTFCTVAVFGVVEIFSVCGTFRELDLKIVGSFVRGTFV